MRPLRELFRGSFLASLLLAGGCAPRVTVLRLVPAETTLTHITTLGLSEFPGEEGQALQSSITDRLVRSGQFSVLDREHLDQLTAEVATSQKLAQYKFPLDVAELLPVTAFIIAEQPMAGYDESESSNPDTCYEIKGALKVREYQCVRRTRRGIAECSADIKVLETTSGRVLVAKDLRKINSKQTETTDGSDPPAIDGNALIAQCRNEMSSEFVNAIAPHDVTEEVVLEDDDKLPALSTGNLYAQARDWIKALSHYQQALSAAMEREPTNRLPAETLGRAYYSVGLGHAMIAEYDLSIESLDKAIQLSPSKDWVELQVRVQHWKRDAETLKEQQQRRADVDR